MIFPEPRKDRLHQQGIAFVSTLVFAVLGFVFLSISQLEISKTSREIFRQIDMANLLPQSLKLGHVNGLESSNGSVQLIAESRGRDIDDTGEEEETTRDVEATIDDQTGGAGSNNVSGNGQEVKPVQNRPREQAVQRPPAQNMEEVKRPQASSMGRRQSNSPDNSGSNNPASSTLAGEGIPKLPLDAFGRDYQNLDVREIIGWMKNNPSELPKGVRQLVRYRPAFLSSVADFEMEGRQYELYLMCKESLFEVHVVLVEQNQATYLVDRSFQKLSTYLRKGQVRRTQDNQIIAVRSNMATNDSSDEFYSLFLSWWEWAQQNQEA